MDAGELGALEPSGGGVLQHDNLTRLLLRSDGLFAQAETALRRTVAATPDDAAALLRLGDVLRGKGKLGEALECYRRVASLRPADRKASWLVAVLSGTALPEQPPAAAPAPFVRQTDFLPPKQCAALLALALASRQRCEPGLVIAPSPGENEQPRTVVEKGFADPARRNALMVDRGIVEQEVRPWFEARLRDAFAEALPRLRLREPREYRVEMGMSAYLGGGFFAAHKDNGASIVRIRLVSFAYYFHRHPKRFSGGELLLHDGDGEAGAFTRIEPRHNSIVFFPGACLHQVAAVESESPDFGDARFALLGGLRDAFADAHLE